MNDGHRKKIFFWINLIWFQAVWFGAILFKDQAVLLLCSSLLAHFLLTPTRKSDAFNLISIALLGSVADFLLASLGILVFEETLFIPVWLILLWAHFSVTLNHSMGWLDNIPNYVRILFGAIFGTLSYYTGSQMGAVVLHTNLLLSLFSLSVIWGSLLPVYTVIASLNRNRFDEKFKAKTHPS